MLATVVGVFVGGAFGLAVGCNGTAILVRNSSAGLAGGGDGADALVAALAFFAGLGCGAGVVVGGLVGYRRTAPPPRPPGGSA